MVFVSKAGTRDVTDGDMVEEQSINRNAEESIEKNVLFHPINIVNVCLSLRGGNDGLR
jgi:hypothetical protein